MQLCRPTRAKIIGVDIFRPIMHLRVLTAIFLLAHTLMYIPKQVVLYSTSKTTKTVDKTAMLEAVKGRFPMDKPFPGLPALKPPGELEVSTELPGTSWYFYSCEAMPNFVHSHFHAVAVLIKW